MSVALGPGASSITDLALQLRIEPSRDDIPAIVHDILEDWHEADLVCTDVFETSDVLEWVSVESGGVPGIAKRLCSALWDELQVGGCDTALSDSSRMAAEQRALDATYDVLRPRFLSMIASAANGGYNRPLELLAQAEEKGFVASETPGVRALTVMGLLAFSPGEDGVGGTYVIGMPAYLAGSTQIPGSPSRLHCRTTRLRPCRAASASCSKR